MTCKDCLHFKACEWEGVYFTDEDIKGTSANNDVKDLCYIFKNKADFVEVVRCKDCLSYHPSPRSKVTINSGYCDICENFVTAEHYCACGERKGVK